jgi:hypothetical protein
VYIAHRNGARWKRVSAPFQDGSSPAAINDITAVTANDLWAVGQRDDRGLVEHHTCHR